VRITGTEDKGDVVVGVYYQSPSQDVSTDELFQRQLGKISGWVGFVLMGGFNFPMMSRSGIFLKFVGDNFFPQALSEPSRKDALLDFLSVNIESDGRWLSQPLWS